MSDNQSGLINTQVLTVRPTQPFPPDSSRPVTYFACPSPNAKMHREDGMTIDFRMGIHATTNAYTIDYLSREVARGHPELRYATEEEVDSFNFHKDPSGYTRAKTMAEMEATIDERVLAILNEKLRERGIEEVLTKDDLAASVAASAADIKVPEPAPAPTPQQTMTDLEKLRQQFSSGGSATSTANMPHSA